MDSILSIQKIDTGPETTDTNSESWDERKKEKFHKKHTNLMNQRLLSRKAKTNRLKEITPTEYNETITYNDDIIQHWDKLNDPNTDIKSTVVDLFTEKNGGKKKGNLDDEIGELDELGELGENNIYNSVLLSLFFVFKSSRVKLKLK